MGGVDLADMLIALYRTNIITRKIWYLKIIFYCVDIAKINAWLLYRRHFQQKEVSEISDKPKSPHNTNRSCIYHNR